MTTLRSATGLCERALRKIGAYSINDSAADPGDLDEALHLLDLEMKYLAGTEFANWLVPGSVTISLTGGEASFALLNRLGNSLTTEGFQFPLWIELDINGNRTPVEMVTRRDFDRLCKPATTGRPEIAHLDRTADPVLRLYPYPATGEDTWDLILTYQTFAADVLPKQSGATRGGNVKPGLPAAWEKWAVTAIAAGAADGPVRRLPSGEVRLMKAEATDMMNTLITKANSEFTSGPPVTEGWDIV
jgi:hypothetical protein